MMQEISQKAVASMIRAMRNGWRVSKIQPGSPHARGSIVLLMNRGEVLRVALIWFDGEWMRGCVVQNEAKTTTDRDAAIASDIRFALEQLAGVVATQYAPSKRLIAAMDALERAIKTIETRG